MAVVAFVPLLLTAPGRVAADTKQYLYLDPGRLTLGAASMWDPSTGMGTVTHQNIGYLWPMGPYYSLIGWLGVPVWVGQRLWMGGLLLAAGWGVMWCARVLGLGAIAAAVSGFAYMLSPYVIDYIARTSAIVMPWSALGWLVGLTAIAARTQRWRPVAAFAWVVAFVGGVNATSILLVGLGPLAWLVLAVMATGEITARQALRAGARIAGASLVVSLWWIAGLIVEGKYGINVIRTTETVATVAHTSSAAEVLRGLGYWYFYGWDKVQPWTQAAVPYTQSIWLLAVSFAVPTVAVALGWGGRWRYRPFAIALIGVGTVVAVGAYPYDRPSAIGQIIKSAAVGSTLALATRSVDRVVPLVVLGMALLLGSGVGWARGRRPALGLLVAVACAGLVAADLPALWTGQLVASNLSRPSAIPGYWRQAAAYLDAAGDSTRVLGLPGEDFAAYAWGVTQDPVAPGLMTRPYVARQVVPAGTPAAADLLRAVDEPLQEGSLDSAAIAPMGRLMSVGDILLQSDLQAERYGLPLPQVLWQRLQPTPSGLTGPVAFGAPDPAVQIRYPLDNEERLALPAGDPQPPALAVFGVPGARPIVRTEAASSPIVVAGDGPGLVQAAAAHLLDTDATILYAASLDRDPAAFAQAMAAGAQLILTDTNLRAGQRWGTLIDNIGEVETLAAPLVTDPSDYQLPLFPGTGSDAQTIAELSGARAVRATAYGNPVTYTPENRPANALDGSRATAWTFGAHSAVAGQRIRIDLDRPVSLDHISLLQVAGTRHITGVTVEVGGRPVARVALGAASLRGSGQVVHFARTTSARVDVVVDGATGGAHQRFDGLSPVGFREITIPGTQAVRTTLRLPTDLLERAGPSSLSHSLTILLARLRAPQPPRRDPERQIIRTFTLPTARRFVVGGTAEIAPTDPDQQIDALTGRVSSKPPGAGGGDGGDGRVVVVAATSSGRLIGDRKATAMAAVDGDPSTAWVPETGPQVGTSVRYRLSGPVTIDHLALQVINDGRHSLPTRVTVSAGRASRTVNLPAVAVGTGRPQGATSPALVSFAPLTGASVTVTIDAVHEVRVPNYYSTFSGATDLLPVGIAEVGLPARAPAVQAQIPVLCRSDLLAVDGRPVPAEVTGASASGLAGRGLQLTGCGPAAKGLVLAPGAHTVTTSLPEPSGWAVDTLSLTSAAGGGAPSLTSAAGGGAPVAATPGPPATAPVKVLHQDRTSLTVRVPPTAGPLWLVLGQSLSSGWEATLPGGRSLGPPVLVDGYANGWYIPGGLHVPTVITIRWTPQRFVWAAIAVSGLGVAGSGVVAVAPPGAAAWIRRSRRPAASRRRWRRRRLAGAGRRGWVPRGGRRLAGAGGGGWLSRRGWLPRGGSRLGAVRRRGAPVVASLLVAGVVGAASRPAIGVVLLAGAAAGGRSRSARLGVRVAAVAAFAAVGLYVVVEQARWRYWPTIDWPLSFASANDLGWLAVALTAADVCAGALAARRARRR